MSAPMVFWLAAGALAVVVAGLLARAILRGGGAARGAAEADIAVYRDQLREVEKDLARGTVTEAEAEAVRTEVSRRLLDADGAAAGGGRATMGPSPRATGAAVALAVLAGAGGLYAWLGAPGYPDLPLAKRIATAEERRLNRPDQAAAEAQMPARPAPDADPDFLDLMARLRSVMADRPNELEGQALLARNEADLGNYAAAAAAQERVIALQGPEATAVDHAWHAELLIRAAGGYVSPEAEEALRAALARDPANGSARFFSGLLAAQTGRPDVAFRLWRGLLETGPQTAPWIPDIRARIADLAAAAGVRYTPPPPRAPGATDLATNRTAAGEMDPEARAEMIRGMVEGLAARLAEDGGPPEDWARLIHSLGVLGETGRAAAIWDEAQTVFPDPADRAPIRAAARAAGVAE